MKENKKENGCERNLNGRFSGELGWKIVQQFTSEEPMNCFGELSNKFASEGCLIDLLKPGSMFSKTKTFCFQKQKPFVLKTVFFSHLAYACVRESMKAREVGRGVTPHSRGVR